MQNIKNFEQFNINESLFRNTWDSALEKVKTDLGINIYFVGKFSMGISLFFPIVQNLIKNNYDISLSNEQVVYLTICTISIILGENPELKLSKENIDKIKEKVEEKGLSKYLMESVKSLMSITILKIVSKQSNKIITGLMDLLSYTALFVPVMNIIINFITNNNVDINLLQQMAESITSGDVLSIGSSALILMARHFYTELLNNVKNPFQERRVKSFESFSY